MKSFNAIPRKQGQDFFVDNQKEHKIPKYKSRFIMKVNDTIIADYANSKCGFINAKEMSIKAVKNMIKN